MAGTAGIFNPVTFEGYLPNPGIGDPSDRAYWVNLLMRISEPVIKNIANNTLKKVMPVEKAAGYRGNPAEVAHLEAFGRTVAGLAPWLTLADDATQEGKLRKRMRNDTLQGITNSVDPAAPDYLNFRTQAQPMVDAAYLCHALLRAPETLWVPLDNTTKTRLITELKQLRRVRHAYNNWVLFDAMVETFLLYNDEEYIPMRIDLAIKKMQEWYQGDGWYSDGPGLAIDYYNGYVIHSMLTDILQIYSSKGKIKKEEYDQALKRMQRYSFLLERMIAPDGTYPVIGRSMIYRIAAFQPLAQLALNHQLPEGLPPGQVRCALTAVMKKLYEAPGTFDQNGWLQFGVCGYQPQTADYYHTTGSLYMSSLGFLPLGLPASDEFWTAPKTEWTSQKVWTGKPVKGDYHVTY